MNLTQNISSYVRRLGAIGVALVMGGLSFTLCAAPPADFPRFEVPGQEAAMNQLRELFWLHYPDAGPKATLWDEWLPGAALWPAVQTGEHAEKMRRHWGETLSARIVDPEGYVATHQHASIAHELGWPFPFWNQGRRGCGWHFSFHNTVGPNWRPHDLVKTDGWTLAGAADGGLKEDGWRIEVNGPGRSLRPAWRCHTYEVPFLQLRWNATGLGASQPFIEWTTPAATNFTRERRFYFNPATANAMTYTMIPMYRHPQWTGEVAQLRIGLGNAAPGGVRCRRFSRNTTPAKHQRPEFRAGLRKIFGGRRSEFPPREPSAMRQAIRYLMTEHQALEPRWCSPTGGTRRTERIQRSPAGRR
jgi:hypothetical protein